MVATTSNRRCRSCSESLAHCHSTLVMHADGSVDCEQLAGCGGDPALHTWWLACTELQPLCGCTGDDRPLVYSLDQAA